MPDLQIVPSRNTPNLPELAPLKPCSAGLRLAMTPETTMVEGKHGMEERVRSWTAPSRVLPEVRREANDRAGLLTTILNSRVSATVARVWLLQLATVTAGSKPLSDLQAQVDGMVGLMAYPSAVFTQETLREAAQRFKFFPGYAEIHALFDPIVKGWETEMKRCEQIALPPSKPDSGAFVRDTPTQMQNVSTLLDKAFGDGWRTRKGFSQSDR